MLLGSGPRLPAAGGSCRASAHTAGWKLTQPLLTHSCTHKHLHPCTHAAVHPCSRAPTRMHPCAPMCTPTAPQCTELSPPRCRGPGDVGGGAATSRGGQEGTGRACSRDERCAASCADSRSSSAALPYEQELKPHRKPQGFPKGLRECSLPPAPLPFPLRVPYPPRPSPDPPPVPQDPALAAPLEAPGCPCPAPHLALLSHGSRPLLPAKQIPSRGFFGFFYFVFLPSPLNHTETPPGAARAQPPASPCAQLPPPPDPKSLGGAPATCTHGGVQHSTGLCSALRPFQKAQSPGSCHTEGFGDPGTPAAAAGAALVGFCAGFCFLL